MSRGLKPTASFKPSLRDGKKSERHSPRPGRTAALASPTADLTAHWLRGRVGRRFGLRPAVAGARLFA